MKKLILCTVFFINLICGGIITNEEYIVSDEKGNHLRPSSTFLSNGNYVICWQKSVWDVYASIYDSKGSLIKEKFQIDTDLGGRQYSPLVKTISNDRFVVGFENQNGANTEQGMILQIYSNDGNRIGERIIIKYMDNSRDVKTNLKPRIFDILGLTSGDFAVIYEYSNNITGKIFDKNGDKIKDRFRINSKSGKHPKRCCIANINSDQFLACWDGYSKNDNVYARIFNNDGSPVDWELRVDLNDNKIDQYPRAVRLSEDKLLITWMHYGSMPGIYGQFFDSEGNKIYNSTIIEPTILKNFSISDHPFYTITSLTDGRFIICWEDNDNIFGQIYNIKGEKKFPEFKVNDGSLDPFNKEGFVPGLGLSSNSDRKFVISYVKKVRHRTDHIIAKNFFSTPNQHNLSKFKLLSPANGTVIDNFQPNFIWEKASDKPVNLPFEINYEIHISEDPDFNDKDVIKNIKDTTYQLYKLGFGETRYWKVKATTWKGKEVWSSKTNSFSTQKRNFGLVSTDEFRIGDGQSPLITCLSDKKFVIAWKRGCGRAKLFDYNFEALSDCFDVGWRPYLHGGIISLDIAPISSEKFIATWHYGDMGAEIYLNITDGPGKQNFQHVQYESQCYGGYPVSTKISEDKLAICYTINNINSEDNYDIFGEIYDTSGTNIIDKFKLNVTSENHQTSPVVASLLDGSFMVCWQSAGQDGDKLGIYGQLFDTTGARIGEEIQINTYNRKDQKDPYIATLGSDAYIVVWESYGQDGSELGVYGQILDSKGNKIYNEFQANTWTKNNQANPVVTSRSNGNFIVCWQSKNQDTDDGGIFLQVFDSQGTKIDNELQVNTNTEFSQKNPSISALTNDEIIISWQSNHKDNEKWEICAKKLPSNYVNIDREKPEKIIPEEFSLHQNYPNPFNPVTTIKYTLSKAGMVNLTVYDVHGRIIKSLVNEYQNAGIHRFNFAASGLSSGIYFYKLQVGNDFSQIRKMMLIK